MRNHKHPTGFSIIELLIAAAVFVTVITIVVDLFLLFIRTNYQQAEQEQLEQSMSFVLFDLSGQLHTSQVIDYSRYGSVTNPQTELYTQRRDSFATGTYFLGTGIPFNEAAGQIYYRDVATGTIEPITPDPVGDIYVDSLEFYVYPSTDPVDVTVSPVVNNQPAVLVRIKAHVTEDSSITATYQTLITSRYYAR